MHGSLTFENSEQFHLQSSGSNMQHVLGANGGKHSVTTKVFVVLYTVHSVLAITTSAASMAEPPMQHLAHLKKRKRRVLFQAATVQHNSYSYS